MTVMGDKSGSGSCVAGVVQRKRGRPRSEASRVAVLKAAAELLDVDQISFDALTVERIASRARVGKQTIYRWWPNKAGVVLDAIIDDHLSLTFPPVPDSGDMAADVRSWMETMLDEAMTEELISMVRHLVAAIAMGSAEVQARLRVSELCENPQLRARFLVEEGRAGLRPGVDPLVVTSAIMDPLLLRMLAIGAPEPEWAHDLVDTVLRGALPATSGE